MTRADDSTAAGYESREILIQADHLHFSYTPAKPVVRGASLRIRAGTISALIGANGSGKSTIIRLLMGLIAPKSGEIRFRGRSITTIPRRDLARQIAYVPQSHSTTFPFTALEVVLTGRSPYSTGFQFENAEDRARARQSLEAVSAAHLADRLMTQISSGERQLVGVARALAQDPMCLLLDEPSASLDLKHRAGLLRILCDLRDARGLTALVVTHDLQLLDPIFDRVFALRDGTILAEGAASEVLTDSVLAEVYDDAGVHARRVEGRTFVWSE